MVGINKTEKAIIAFAKFISSLIVYKNKKKGWWFVIRKLLPRVIALKCIFLDRKEIGKELKDLDPLEMVELQQAFEEAFDLPDDEKEKLVEQGFNVGATVIKYVANVIHYIKR